MIRHGDSVTGGLTSGPNVAGSIFRPLSQHGSKSHTRSKISEISHWQTCFSELKISNPRISCTLKWSEEKFLKGSVGHQIKLYF